MSKKRLEERSWYSNAVAICIGVIFFIVLWRLPELWISFKTFLGFFETIIFGCIIAYIVNPLTSLFGKLFKGIKADKIRNALSIFLTFFTVIAVFILFLFTLVPQIVDSIESLLENFDKYSASLTNMIMNWKVAGNNIDLTGVIESSEDILGSISQYISNNSDSILSVTTNIGKGVLQWIVALIVAVYLVAEKPRLKAALKRLLKALFDKEKYNDVSSILRRCNTIFTNYIVFSFVDALIVGSVNFIFMTILQIDNAGLVSVLVATTNLIPTFGPFVGAAIGGFIILMTNPSSVLIFVIFTLILQLIDGYVIKPKLFGDTFGVSGLWIVAGVIIGGSMFGVIGILLAIPGVAVIDYIYKTYIITGLEKRRKES